MEEGMKCKYITESIAIKHKVLPAMCCFGKKLVKCEYYGSLAKRTICNHYEGSEDGERNDIKGV